MSERFESAKAMYAKVGVDVEKALERLAKIPVSLHCWQIDDIDGFEKQAGGASGGIQTTGNYPGKASGVEQVLNDMDFALQFVPGKKRINLHANYAITDEVVDRDKLEPKHFDKWIEYAKERGYGLDFNATFFGHPKAESGLTLSNPDDDVRNFWIRHAKACRKIAAYMGEKLGAPTLHNLWIPDGYKDVPADRLGPRQRLKDSLDQIYADKYDKKYLIDSVESKVFGIGVESYTVGSSEFYMNYAAKNGICCLLDNGHYHPLEYVSDKIPSLLLFNDYVALHVTRGVRWDSDHVVTFEDELKEIAKEIIRNNADERVLIGLDYFDASINRVSAWVVGARNMQKALLWALLLPNEELKNLQNAGNHSKQMVLTEDMKTMPFGDVWAEYLSRQGVKGDIEWFNDVEKYEKEVMLKR